MRAHKLRSFLMLLGIILSVSTLILVVALISGMNEYFATASPTSGSNVFLIHKFPIISDAKELLKATRRNRDITWDDYESLRDNLKLAQGVGVEVRRTANLRTEAPEPAGCRPARRDRQYRRHGCGRGRYRSLYHAIADNEHRDRVCMIGADVADKLFASTDPLGKILEHDGQEFQIVGVAKKIGNTFGQSQDNFVYIPIQTWLKIYGRNTTLSVNVQARGRGMAGADTGRSADADAGTRPPGAQR